MARVPDLRGSIVPQSMTRTSQENNRDARTVTAPINLGLQQYGSYTAEQAVARMHGEGRAYDEDEWGNGSDAMRRRERRDRRDRRDR